MTPPQSRSLRELSEAATPGPISLNPKNRLTVRTSMDHPMCQFSDPYHRQHAGGEGADPEFMVALWNYYRNGWLVEKTPVSETDARNDPIDLYELKRDLGFAEWGSAEHAEVFLRDLIRKWYPRLAAIK